MPHAEREVRKGFFKMAKTHSFFAALAAFA
jgi:hypothetical protein